jgi:hypothetical protein
VRRSALAILCSIALLAGVTAAQSSPLEPVRVAAGATLAFHLQTRLNPNIENQTDALPAGTVLHIKMLTRLDSSTDHDGAEFHGVIISPVLSGSDVVLHEDADVTGVLALLRSKSHPDGFRYDLLITRVVDHGKSFYITASLNSSFFESAPLPAPASKAGTK